MERGADALTSEELGGMRRLRAFCWTRPRKVRRHWLGLVAGLCARLVSSCLIVAGRGRVAVCRGGQTRRCGVGASAGEASVAAAPQLG